MLCGQQSTPAFSVACSLGGGVLSEVEPGGVEVLSMLRRVIYSTGCSIMCVHIRCTYKTKRSNKHHQRTVANAT